MKQKYTLSEGIDKDSILLVNSSQDELYQTLRQYAQDIEYLQ